MNDPKMAIGFCGNTEVHEPHVWRLGKCAGLPYVQMNYTVTTSAPVPRPGEVTGTYPQKPLLPTDSPLWNAMMPSRQRHLTFPLLADVIAPGMHEAISKAMAAEAELAKQKALGLQPEQTGRTRSSFDESREHPMMQSVVKAAMEREDELVIELEFDGVSRDTIDILTGVQPGPKLWETEPLAIVHIAGACLELFGRYMRQRCDWCGIILLEYDLTRVQMITTLEPGEPGHWTPGSMVLIDGNMSAEYVPNIKDGQPQLPPFACAFDPKTQVK